MLALEVGKTIIIILITRDILKQSLSSIKQLWRINFNSFCNKKIDFKSSNNLEKTSIRYHQICKLDLRTNRELDEKKFSRKNLVRLSIFPTSVGMIVRISLWFRNSISVILSYTQIVCNFLSHLNCSTFKICTVIKTITLVTVTKT